MGIEAPEEWFLCKGRNNGRKHCFYDNILIKLG